MDLSLHSRLATQRGPQLLKLAHEVFGDDLNKAEIALFERLGVLDGRPLIAPINDVMSLPQLRANRVAWLLVDPEARNSLTPNGIQIQFVTFQGKLDIAFCQADLPLMLKKCHLDEGLILHDAKLSALNLLGSHCGPIFADRIKVKGSVFLKKTIIRGEVRLVNMEVGGNLECSGATFKNPNFHTFSADGTKVKGNVFFRDEFSSRGEVRLLGADVGRSLDCSGATFDNPNGYALNADDIKVKGSIFLGDKFTAKGVLDFTNATIEGWFVHTSVKEPSKTKLRLTGARVAMLCDGKDSWPETGKLHLDNFHYDRIYKKAPWDVKDRLEWLRRQPEGEFSSQPYEQLAKVYREAGREEDALEILYAKNAHRAECIYKGIVPASLFSKIWIEFTWLVFGYGCRPKQALLSFAFLVFFGSFAYLAFGVEKLITVTALNLDKHNATLTDYNPLYYSLDAAIPLVELGQTAAWTMSGWLAQGYNAFHTVAGWVIVLLLVGALTGLIKK